MLQHRWSCSVLRLNVLTRRALRFTVVLLHVFLQHLVQGTLSLDTNQHDRDYRSDSPHDDNDELHTRIPTVVVCLLVVVVRQEARRSRADEDVGDGAGDKAKAAEGVVAEVDRGDSPARRAPTEG